MGDWNPVPGFGVGAELFLDSKEPFAKGIDGR